MVFHTQGIWSALQKAQNSVLQSDKKEREMTIVLGLKAAGSHSRTSARAQAATEMFITLPSFQLFMLTSMHLNISWCSLQALWIQPSNSSVSGQWKPRCAESWTKILGPFSQNWSNRAQMLSALQPERPKPYFIGEPRADKCKLSALGSCQCAQPGG